MTDTHTRAEWQEEQMPFGKILGQRVNGARLSRRVLRGTIRLWWLFFLFLKLPDPLYAQQSLIPPSEEPAAKRPSIQLIRYAEDWSSKCDAKNRSDFLDPVKCMSMRALGEHSYVSLGGEFRGVYEDVLDDSWSNTPFPTNSFWLERFQLHADFHFDPHVRLFLQLESGQEQGRPGGPRAIDKKNLDFLNAFLELDRGSGSKTATAFRIGRQEMQYGAGRLVAVREGPNVRQGFYAARITQKLNLWTLDAFAARPAKDDPGFFDNGPLQTTSFWGVYAERALGGDPARVVDFYYFGLDRKSATFNKGTVREQRQTVGARIAAGAPRLDDLRLFIPHYDIEAVYQFGSFGSGSIGAWTIASELGMTLPRLPARPRVGLRADTASGDHDPSNGNLGTFNPLFPIGNYFGVLSDTGPGPVNFYDLHPNIRTYFRHNISADTDWVIWWRQSLSDGIYNVPGNLFVPAGSSQARFVGHRPGIEVRWQCNSHFYVQGDYGVFFAGPFLQQSARPHNLNYASMWIGYKF
jgi:hypothetical protein